MQLNKNRPVNRTTQGVNNTNSLTENIGKHEWLVASKFHEIGGPRQREATKTFTSQEDAKAFFDEQAARLLNVFGKTSNATIEQSDAELVIHVDGVQIVNMSFLADPRQCA